LNIGARHRENNKEKVVRYINGMRYAIQDEINMMIVKIVEDSYQVALKVEGKFSSKQYQGNIGKVPSQGRGTIREKL
jgi:hypothetical protein